ncbi:hypothetical protein J2W49_004809 [Hydrogenophaga palleronii]|uniref:Lipoprotein n=1 Tax=Hydrogenophaga palleronii TaxID=65655 RepID=A0ABU1WU35_9BURK|nr:hypothetical protein [Hydrogenophaga palleronii]MDR7152831.1 hypothetical protein [Hydrogenophaga palleronii]
MKRLQVALCAIFVLGVLGACKKDEDSARAAASASGTTPKTPGEQAQDAKARPLLPPANYPYPKGGVTIGQGWDTYNDAGTSATCVQVAAMPLETATYASNVKLAQSSVSTLKEQTLAIKASFKGTGTKSSGSLDQEKSRQLNVDALNYLFTFEAENGSTFAVPLGVYEQNVIEPARFAHALKQTAAQAPGVAPQATQTSPSLSHQIRFTPEAEALLRAKAFKAFSAKCGEGFVASIHRGAKVEVVLTLSSTSTVEKDKLTVALSGSGYGVSASLRSSTVSNKQVELNNVGFRTFQEGGIPFSPSLVAPKPAGKQADIVDFTKLQPEASTLLQNPTAYRVLVVPYENLDPSLKGNLPTPLQLMSVAKYYVALKDVYNLVDNIIEDSRRKAPAYVSTQILAAYGGVPRLVSLKDQIQFDLAVLELALNSCASRDSDCLVSDSFVKVTAKIQQSEDAASAAAREAAAEAKKLDWNSAISALPAAGKMSIQIGGMTPSATVPPSEVDKAKAELQKLFEERLASAEAALDKFASEHKSLREEIALQPEKDLPDSFYMRFYWYLAQLPPPKEVEADYISIASLTIPAGKSSTDIISIVEKVREEVGNATMNVRLLPWKRFFCDDLKHEALCVSERSLMSLVDAMAININDVKLEVLPPLKPKKKRCKSIGGSDCWRF